MKKLSTTDHLKLSSLASVICMNVICIKSNSNRFQSKSERPNVMSILMICIFFPFSLSLMFTLSPFRWLIPVVARIHMLKIRRKITSLSFELNAKRFRFAFFIGLTFEFIAAMCTLAMLRVYRLIERIHGIYSYWITALLDGCTTLDYFVVSFAFASFPHTKRRIIASDSFSFHVQQLYFFRFHFFSPRSHVSSR